MEGFVVCQFELLFQYVDGIKEIKSRNIQQIALVGNHLPSRHRHGASDGAGGGNGQSRYVADATGNLAADGDAPRRGQRASRLLSDGGQNNSDRHGPPTLRRTSFARWCWQNVPGTVAVSPFGPNVRSIMVKCDPEKLEAYNLSPHDVTTAMMAGNAVVPAGNLYIKDSMPMVPNNATVTDVQDLGKIPLRLGENVYIRDVATIEDKTDLDFARRARQRQELGVSADHQEEHRVDADGGRRHPQIDAVISRCRAEGRNGRIRIRRIADGARRRR